MLQIANESFEEILKTAIDNLPSEHAAAVKNVAITYASNPTAEQRVLLRLRNNETLFGLYEGVPLPRRQGSIGYGPDRITLFKTPICNSVTTIAELKEQVRHTLWHEVAHYFGLNHDQIASLEKD